MEVFIKNHCLMAMIKRLRLRFGDNTTASTISSKQDRLTWTATENNQVIT